MAGFKPILAAATATLMLAGCGRQERAPAPAPAPRPVQPLAPGRAAPSAAAYVAAASSIDLFEIRSSELALQRSRSAKIREFASMMISAHRGTGAQLSLAGRRLNLLPSSALSPRHQGILHAISVAADFDAAYRAQQRIVHEEALALHSSYAARGASPTLRPVAAAAVPVIQRHMRLLRYL